MIEYLNRKDEGHSITIMDSKDSKDPKEEGNKVTIFSDFNEFKIGDLLELLQGPVQLEGQIVIATTNHYDKIKEICPALFRPGRLTPIHFDYLDRKSLDQMSEFYFGQTFPFTFKGETCEVQTSKIVQAAL